MMSWSFDDQRSAGGLDQPIAPEGANTSWPARAVPGTLGKPLLKRPYSLPLCWG